MDGIIGLNGENLTVEERSIENAKQSILIIEKFFYAVNAMPGGPPLRLAEDMINGMKFLNQMHAKLLAELGPEEVEKMKAANQPKTPPGVQ